MTRLTTFYNHLVFKQSWTVLIFVAILTLTAGFCALDFELDASPESLVLENDKSLEYYRQTREQYGTDEFLIITYTPDNDFLSQESLNGLESLRDQLLEINSVQSVVSILDAPIVYNAGVKLSELGENLKTIQSPDIDKALARKEFQTNPFYRDLIVSNDGKTTALQVIFYPDEKYFELIKRRNNLHRQSSQHELTKKETGELANVVQQIKEHNSEALIQREKDINIVREIMNTERHHAKLFLGGIPMITVDMIRFIRHDLVVFGIGVITFLILILMLFFRTPRWVLIPLLCCLVTGTLMIGFMGLSGWKVTVISSNFLSILLILTLSLTIHLIVRFRDLQIISPRLPQSALIRDTVASMVRPCFYTILTTAVAFASLIVSEIGPVIDFGWIMVIGLGVAFIVSFLMFPASIALLPATPAPPSQDFTRKFTLWVAQLVQTAPWTIIFISGLLIIAIGIGTTRLKVENRFIDNFKSSTEIYQGMQMIDQKLGGTTPLDVIIDPDQDFYEVERALADETSDFDDLFLDSVNEPVKPNYWLNPDMMEKVKTIQEHLESYSITGKVLSIATAIQVIERLNGEPLDEFELALLRKRVPDDIANDLVDPYLSADSNQIRFSVRVIESDPSLNRKQLLGNIRKFLVDEMHFEDSQIHLTGMLVLYNNMLQSLFRSQILTFGAVFLAIFITFVFLFRSFILALIGIIPNIFSATLILGIMGWLSVPLDMVTITIASITIGISVDDTIHYIHRLKHEYLTDKNYSAAIKRCHGGIGKAMFYTSVAIIFGFAVLGLSNFIPTIYFGLLTGIAMLVALIGNLLLLPAIILMAKPHIAATITNR
jgi:uncharacterized protein